MFYVRNAAKDTDKGFTNRFHGFSLSNCWLNIGKLDLIQSGNNMPYSFKWASVDKEALLQPLEVKKAGFHILLAFPPRQVQSACLNLQRECAQLSLAFSK